MSTRLFSILRRKSDIIDFITPLQPDSAGVVGYSLRTNLSFDPNDAFSTTILTSTQYGFEDPSTKGKNVIQPGNNVRIVFDPTNYGLTDAYFWLKLVFMDSISPAHDLTTPAPSAATLVLPPYVGNEQAGFSGTAPAGTDISESLRIDLPRVMDNVRIRNLGAAVGGGFSSGSFDSVSSTPIIYVAYQEFGPEIAVPPGIESIGFCGLVSSIWIRADGATASGFTAQFRYANPLDSRITLVLVLL